jgi:hypothetical protein
MQLVSIETSMRHACLSKFAKSLLKPSYLKLFHLKLLKCRIRLSSEHWALDIWDGQGLRWKSRLVQHQEFSEHERSELEKRTAQLCWWPLHVCPILWQVGEPNLCIDGWLLSEKKIRLPGNFTTFSILKFVFLLIQLITPALWIEEYGDIRGGTYAGGVHVFVRFNRRYSLKLFNS